MRHTLLVLAGCVAGAVPAQNVIPRTAAVFDANSQSYLPFLYYDGTRVQMVYQADQVCTVNATIRGIGFRRDMQDNRAMLAQTVGPCDMFIGYSPNPPGQLSSTFASNISGSLTTLFTGVTLSLPAQPSAQVFAPFSVPIPFPTPFAYTRASGNLLIEYVVPGRATRKLLYPVDGAFLGSEGQSLPVGDPPQLSMGELLYLYSAASTCVPGGVLDIQATGLRQAYVALLFVGTSSDLYNGIWLPFDMTPLGAPGSVLYTGVDVALPFPVAQSGSTWRATASLPVPGVQFLAGKPLFVQSAFVDGANSLGVVLSTMNAITIGGTLASPVVDAIASSDSTAATGNNLVRGGFTGPVTAFDGVFN
jgi:hypothetical protein